MSADAEREGAGKRGGGRVCRVSAPGTRRTPFAARGRSGRFLAGRPWLPVVAYFFVVFAIGVSVFSIQGGVGRSWQEMYGPAVFLACDNVLGWPAEAIESREEFHPDFRTYLNEDLPWVNRLADFLFLKTDSFDCKSIPEGINKPPLGEVSPSFQSVLDHGSFLQLLTVGLLWKITGVAWWVLIPIGALYLATATTAFALILRIFFSPFLAFSIPLVPMLFPYDWFLTERLRDFAKVPPTMIGILIVLYMARKPASDRLVGMFLLLGLVMGVGANLRTEVHVFGLLFLVLAALTVFIRGEASEVRRLPVALLGGSLVFLACYLPIQFIYAERPRIEAHWLLLGFSDERLAEARWAVGDLSPLGVFQDQTVYKQVLAHHEQTGGHGLSYLTTEYGTAAWDVFLHHLSVLPFHALIRIPGAVYDYLSFPLGRAPAEWPFAAMRISLVIFGLIALFSLWRRHAILGFAVTALLLGTAVIASLDYEWRHGLHLRKLFFVLSVAGVMLTLQALCPRVFARGPTLFRRLPAVRSSRALRCILGGLAVFAVLLAAASAWQVHAIGGVRDRLLAADATRVAAERRQARNGTVLIAPPEGIERPFVARYSFDLERCGRSRIAVRHVRDAKVSADHVALRHARIERAPGDRREHYFLVAHDNIYTRFSGLVLDAGDAACFQELAVLDVTGNPFIYELVYDGEWSPLGEFLF